MSTLLNQESAARTEERRRFLIDLVYAGVFLALLLLVIFCAVKWAMPFILAFAVAAIFQRPIRWLVKKTGVKRQFFSVALLILMILLLAGLLLFLGWTLAVRITNFVSNPENVQAIEAWIGSVTEMIQGLLENLSDRLSPAALETVNNAIAGISSKISEALSSFFAGAAGWVMRFATQSLPRIAIAFIIWVVASILLSIHYQGVKAFLVRQVPDRFQGLLRDVRDLCGGTGRKLLRAYGLLMLLTFAELSVGLLLLRVPNAILVAALIAMVDILPVLGTGTVVLPWAVIVLIQGNIRLFIGLIVMYAVIALVRNILEPRLVSRQIGLHPLATLFFMYIGLQTLGLLGMLLFPALVMVLKQLQEDGKIHLWK